MAHDAFISYSRKDKAFAMRLHKALSSYVPPKDLPLPQRRLDVFLDAEDFTGAEYYQALDRHLGSSGKLIVVCSPAARASSFVNDEIQRFARAKGPQHIVALLAGGIPNNEATAQQQEQMAFPDALCEAMQMPLAADYRGFDPKRSGVDRGAYEASWYTTLANVFDVSRAEIEQREKKRRARRRQINLAIAAVSVFVLAGLSSIAWQQWQDAARQSNVSAARLLTSQAVAMESMPASQGLRLRALIAAQSLRKAWTREGYDAWRRATLQMPPVLGRADTHAGLIDMSFTDDGTRLFALCGERHVHVFSVPDLRQLKQFEAEQTAQRLVIDAKGEHALAFKPNDEFLEAFDVRQGTKRSVFLPTNFTVASFNPAGEIVAASPTHLWVLDASSDDVRSRIHFPQEVSAVMLSPDAASVLASTDKTVAVYDTADGKLRWQLPLNGEGSLGQAFSGDGRSVAIGQANELVIVDAVSGDRLQSLPVNGEARGGVGLLREDAYVLGNEVHKTSGSVAFTLRFAAGATALRALASRSGRYVAGHPEDDAQSLAIHDLSIADFIPTTYLTLREGHRGKAAAFSSDGHVMALSSGASGYGQSQAAELQLVSLQPDRWIPIFPSRSRTGDLSVLPPDSRVVVQPRSSPQALSFDAAGARIADDGGGTFVSPSGRFAARNEAGKGWIVTDTQGQRSITVAANGSPLEYSPDEQRVLVFPHVQALGDADAPQVVADAKPFHQSWSYPGSRLVIGVDAGSMSMSDARKSTLFDWETGKVSEGPASVNSLYAVAPDGRRFATYDHDGIQLWKTGAAKPFVRSGRANLSFDTPMYFSRDGALLAIAGCGRVPLYDGHTLVPSFEVPIGRSCFAGLSLDGQYVVSRTLHANHYPEPTLHPITLDGVLRETCSKVRDDLSEREWQRLGGTPTATCATVRATPPGPQKGS